MCCRLEEESNTRGVSPEGHNTACEGLEFLLQNSRWSEREEIKKVKRVGGEI